MSSTGLQKHQEKTSQRCLLIVDVAEMWLKGKKGTRISTKFTTSIRYISRGDREYDEFLEKGISNRIAEEWLKYKVSFLCFEANICDIFVVTYKWRRRSRHCHIVINCVNQNETKLGYFEEKTCLFQNKRKNLSSAIQFPSEITKWRVINQDSY